MICRQFKNVMADVLNERVESRDWTEVTNAATRDYSDEMMLSNVEKWRIIWKVKDLMGFGPEEQYAFERFVRREIWI